MPYFVQGRIRGRIRLIFNPDRLYGGWFWGLKNIWNDWDHIYSDPYEVELPDGFYVGETVTGMKAVFADDDNQAYEIFASSSKSENCVPVLIGGSHVRYIRLEKFQPLEK